MFAAGIRQFISIRELAGGRYAYVIGKMGPFQPTNLTELAAKLNDAEGISGDDTWGGRSTIIGSPRVAGSGVDPDRLAKIVAQNTGTA